MIIAVLGNVITEALNKFSFSNVGEDQITLFILGFSTVFIALTLIYLLINSVPKVLKLDLKKVSKATAGVIVHNKVTDVIVNKHKKETETSVMKTTVVPSDNEEVSAAIAMAMSLYLDDCHDDESFVLTMKINERLSSTWNHKVQNVSFYNFNNLSR
jgi:hypothetical protein